MIDRLVALIVDEGKWLTLSMTVAGVGIALIIRHRGRLFLSATGSWPR